MRALARPSWLALMVIHVIPGAVLVVAPLLGSRYGVTADGDSELLLVHRATLFVVVAVACGWAILDQRVRRLATVVTALSVIGYLVTYARYGAPPGPLRTTALVDVVALAPLAVVATDAWSDRPRSA